MEKRAQQSVGMSFGTIFALFLIVIFIIIAFVAIGMFLGLKGSFDIGDFYKDLQKAVDRAWESQESSFEFKTELPSDIKKICFGNLSKKITANKDVYSEIQIYDIYDANVFLYPPGAAGELPFKKIEHLDLDRITKDENPFCVDAGSNLRISKEFYSKYVLIS